jgi:TonB family protein
VKFFILPVLLFLFSVALAQKKDNVIYRDTINIQGFIYDERNQPVAGMEIGLLYEFHPTEYPLVTKTDKNGFFQLKGARPDDSLTIVDGRYSYHPFANHGSRFMVIYLPAEKVINRTAANPIVVNAKRIYPKSKGTFYIATHPDLVFDGGAITVYPEFVGGDNKFFNLIRSKLTYPDRAITLNIEGTVEVGFTVGPDGHVSNVELLKGIGYGCDEQVIEAVKALPKWRPGIFCGRPMTIKETIAVQFKLNDN